MSRSLDIGQQSSDHQWDWHIGINGTFSKITDKMEVFFSFKTERDSICNSYFLIPSMSFHDSSRILLSIDQSIQWESRPIDNWRPLAASRFNKFWLTISTYAFHSWPIVYIYIDAFPFTHVWWDLACIYWTNMSLLRQTVIGKKTTTN